MLNVLLILLGVGLLYLGGELLIRFATSLALRLKLSPLVIGLTVVAFGTSAPELAATLTAALNGSVAIATGNVIGSNTANLGLILGLCAVLLPVGISKLGLRRDIPIMVFAAVLPLIWFLDGVMSRTEGLITFLLLVTYVVWMLRTPQDSEEELAPHTHALWLSLLGIIGGLALLVGGAQLLVEGASNLARAFGVPEKVIGLTLVAVGTSLPELASSLVAVFRRQTDMVLGNIIGSNIFNVLGILGISSFIVPLVQPFADLRFDIFIMIAFSLVTALFLLTRSKLVRWEGFTLMAVYFAYIVWLF